MLQKQVKHALIILICTVQTELEECEVQEATMVYRQHLDRNHAGVSRDGPVH